MTTVEKNQTYTVTIDDLSHEGLGVAHIDGYPLFIENALPEEEMTVKVVKVGKKFGYGKVIERFNANPERQEVKDQDLLRSDAKIIKRINGNIFLCRTLAETSGL